MHDIGRPDQAIDALNHAIEINPQSAPAHYNLALSLLQQGDYRRGLAEYEYRAYAVASRQKFSTPPWDGRDIAGKTILLHAEGGFGDVIQFVRFVPMVKARGGTPILMVQSELVRLFAAIDGTGAVIPKGQNPPPFQVHCPLLSLAGIFRTTLANIPNIVPYLRPDPALFKAWRQKLGPGDGQMRVGLAWAGNPQLKGDRTRSLNLQQLAPFAAAHGVKFFSLQKGLAGEQAKNPPPGLELVDLGPELNDFADTAAALSLMDLIITTDTSVAHLAGALGKPVWVMLQFVADWRWLRNRADSPWYPTMRIFRQKTPGDWGTVIGEVFKALA